MTYTLGLSMIVHLLLIIFDHILKIFRLNSTDLKMGNHLNWAVSTMVIIVMVTLISAGTFFTIHKSLEKDSNVVLISKLIGQMKDEYANTSSHHVYAATDIRSENDADIRPYTIEPSTYNLAPSIEQDIYPGGLIAKLTDYCSAQESLAYSFDCRYSFLNFNLCPR